MYLFRIHIRPQGGSADMPKTFDYCLRHELLGVGWRTESQNNTKNWDEFYKEASSIHDNLDICKYINKWVSEGDLVWTRDLDGHYYLARVKSGWEYWTCEEADNNDIDIANIFRCEIRRVDIDEVPGNVVACFRPARTIQEIADSKAREYSKHLWNKISGNDTYEVDNSLYSDIFMMLDDEETEDLLFLYLQSKGWYVLPNSRKADTMSFEFLVVNPISNERALTQVKTGNTQLNIDDYANIPSKVFLFQSNEIFCGQSSPNVVCVSRQELIDFMDSSTAWLPKSFTRKIDLLRK